ncbi:hypothetical protein B296_00054429 [Ensete ventricosum]|uniref:Uncharacterized protein n=1 Tax=Ensete ventricosum TaxID=4639 RepID=A0A426X1N1_ENSVE|nr:hypothetical protein B296_00054429 [Ensete ventricosum]
MSLCVGILLHKPYRAAGVILLHFSHSCFAPQPPPSKFIALPDSSITFPISGQDGLFFLPFPLLLPLVFMFFLDSLAWVRGVLKALRVMKSCHDFDSVVIEESLVTIRERYSIPDEYALHAPLLGQHPLDPYPNELSVFVDVLEAGLQLPLHPVIKECLG